MALISEEFDPFFMRVAEVLATCGDKVVIVGGCANALYRFAESAQSGPAPLATYDIDIAASNRMPRNAPALLDKFAELGLTANDSMGPTNKYHLGADSRMKVELLCPAVGLPTLARNRRPALVDIQENLFAEALELIELLRTMPWQVDLQHVPELSVHKPLVVYLPHPLMYVVQKALVHNSRQPHARRKDCYYIYEVAVLFRNSLFDMAKNLIDVPVLVMGNRIQRARNVLAELFGHDAAEGVQETILIASDSGQALRKRAVIRAVDRLVQALDRAATGAVGGPLV